MEMGSALIAAAIEKAKAGDPLAPVTVVPASAAAAASLRRSLVRRGGGIANTRFLTMLRVAESIVGARVACVLTRALRYGIVRAVAQSAAGQAVLGAASLHPQTLRALDARFRELRRAHPRALDALPQSGIVGLYHDYRERAAPYMDDVDVLRAATELLAADPNVFAGESLGHVIAQEPPASLGFDAPEQALLGVLLGAGLADVVSVADDALKIPPATRVVIAPDAETEVRLAVGELVRLADAGTPFARMAVVHAGIEPYPRLVPELLDAAGIAWGGSEPTTLAETIAGRTLIGLLGLADSTWSRVALMGVLAGAPLVDDTTARRWEAQARDANVVAGVSQWRERLGPDSDLASFVEDLARKVEPPRTRTWSALTEWACALVPDVDDRHREPVVDAVGALAALEDSSSVDVRAFTDAVANQLDVQCGSRPFGRGVMVGTASDLIGAEPEAGVVLGMVEGGMPLRRADDPLLPDAMRVLTDGALPTRRDRREREFAALSCVLHGARERIACAPRADQRAQQRRLPSRWLLDAAPRAADADAAPARVSVAELDDLASAPPHWLLAPPSVASVLLDRPAATAQEDALQQIAAGMSPDDFALGRGFAAVRARRSADITEWDGGIDEHAFLSLDHKLLSATSLETWATCPFRYFLGSVLRVAETAVPEARVGIDPLDRGSLVHEVLERAVLERLDDHHHRDVHQIADDVCAGFERTGRTGRPLPWLLERRTLDAHLSSVIELDREDASATQLQPIRAEVRFGDGEDCDLPAAVIELDDGTQLRFRGQIDRIDASADRRAVRVVDYKTGRADSYKRDLVPKRGQAHDPTASGTRLQLPIYAVAAAPEAAPGAELRAEYWFVTDPGYPRVPVTLDESTADRLREVLGQVAAGIEEGAFPAVPGEAVLDSWQHCRYCPYDRVCPADRGEAAARKREHPHARRHAELRLISPESS